MWLSGYGIGAAAFFPSNFAGRIESTGPESHGVLGAVQRMAINIGTAIDVTVSGTILAQGSSQYHLLFIHDIRACWVYGALTLTVATLGLMLSPNRRARGHVS